jgi:ABC-type uncharacterized transport system ATPase subunit
VRLTLSAPVEAADISKYGKLIGEIDDDRVVLEVPREETASSTAAMLQYLPVSDVGIEEVSIEDVIRELFTRAEA